ncbi:YihY/virulence factor BrkB family protein [Pseudomonas sp. R2.Fl]|nr:YihY/virulence factor BrkB family protein [Pseudomonas sp. R2.Fl]
MPTFLRMLYRVSFDAVYHFSEDDGWAMASHVALSALLAVFPFLIFGTALAGFLGADQFSDTAIHLIFDTWPAVIAKPLSDELLNVLTMPRGGLLTVSVLAAAYFASNGVEALRAGLNRAYRVTETRPWYITRLISLGFMLGAVVVFAVVSVLLVAVPVALAFAERWFPWMKDWLAAVAGWRVSGTVALLVVGLLLSHLGLPAGRRRLIDVLPGVVLTLLLWMVGALIFTSYLSSFANYAATYAGLASIMIVIVFLYMIGVIFLIGAEFNAALMKFAAARRKSSVEGNPDEAANI